MVETEERGEGDAMGGVECVDGDVGGDMTAEEIDAIEADGGR